MWPEITNGVLLLPGAAGCRSFTRLNALRLRGFSADDDEDDNDDDGEPSSRNRDVIQVPCAPVNAGPAMGAAAADPCLSVTPRDGADIERKSACMSFTDHPETRKRDSFDRAERETTDTARKTVRPTWEYTHTPADVSHFPPSVFKTSRR